MLRKMLIQGLIGAALIGSAAAVYAQMQGGSQDNGYLAAPAPTQSRDRNHDRDDKGRHVGEHRERHDARDEVRLERHGRGHDRNDD